MAPHSSTLAWKIPWMEEPGRLQSMGSLSQTRLSNFTFNFHFPLSYTGEGNGNPLLSSCLENPRDRGAWWAAVYGVAQSWTRPKRLSSSSSSNFIIKSTLAYRLELKTTLTCDLKILFLDKGIYREYRYRNIEKLLYVKKHSYNSYSFIVGK